MRPVIENLTTFISHYVQIKRLSVLIHRLKFVIIYIPLRSDKTIDGVNMDAGFNAIYIPLRSDKTRDVKSKDFDAAIKIYIPLRSDKTNRVNTLHYIHFVIYIPLRSDKTLN